MTATRKLAAILAADVIGFSRMAGVDEDRTLARLQALRSDLIDPTISVHNGRVIKRTGDGALVEFRGVVDAVRCAIEVTLGTKPSNTSMLVGQRPRVREAICAAYAQAGRTETIKATRFARRVYMRRSTARVVVRPIAYWQDRKPPSLPPGSVHGRGRESRQARRQPVVIHIN